MIIPLTKGYVTVVDSADYDALRFFTWHARECGTKVYAAAGVFGRETYMHRFLMGEPEGVEIDHRDEDGLNNRRLNLRYAKHHQNLSNRGLQENNTSGYKGVGLHIQSGLWGTKIKHKGVWHSVGYHETPDEAARYYNLKAKELRGEFATFNNVAPLFPLVARDIAPGGRPRKLP